MAMTGSPPNKFETRCEMPRKKGKILRHFKFLFEDFLPRLGLTPTPQEVRAHKDAKDGNRSRHRPKGQRRKSK